LSKVEYCPYCGEESLTKVGDVPESRIIVWICGECDVYFMVIVKTPPFKVVIRSQKEIDQ